MNVPDIKLFVCCHQETKVPKHPLLLPIQVGAALADHRFFGFLHDDTGENISWKNRSYCELTAQYWAWKNVEAHYYGFFHYRRYLYPEPAAKLPYRIEKEPSLQLLDKLGYSKFAELIRRHDLIVPKGENMYVSVREHYANAPYHHYKDLRLVEEIIQERSPEMVKAMEEYLSGTICYFGNIYIMRREVFQDYCAWLFPILAEFDRRADTTNYSLQEQRVDGYLAERLFGVYITAMKAKSHYQILEIPRLHLMSTNYRKQCFVNMLLPPSTYRRYVIKKFQKYLNSASL